MRKVFFEFVSIQYGKKGSDISLEIVMRCFNVYNKLTCNRNHLKNRWLYALQINKFFVSFSVLKHCLNLNRNNSSRLLIFPSISTQSLSHLASKSYPFV